MAWKLDLYEHLCCHHNFKDIFLCFETADSFTLGYNQSAFDWHLLFLKVDLQSCFVYKKLLFPVDYLRETGEKISYFFPMCSQLLFFILKSIENLCSLLTTRWVVQLMFLRKERDAIQRDLGRLQRWANVSLMKLNKAKGNVLHLGRGNHQYP